MNNAGYTRYLSPNLAGGTHSLVATYSGDNSYQASKSVTTIFTVTPAVSQIQLDSYPTNPVLGQTFQLEANVTSQVYGNPAYPSGTVTFYDGSTALTGAVQITKGATGQIFADIYNVSFSTPGSHTITAKYSGDSNYTSATSPPVTISCLIATAITLAVSSTNINYGQSVTLTAVVTSSAKGPAISNQVFFEGSQTAAIVSATPGTDANGNQTLTVTATTAPSGSGPINAIFQQDANYGPSVSPFVSITVNIPDFTLAPGNGFSLVPVAGQPGSMQITVTPLTQTPSTGGPPTEPKREYLRIQHHTDSAAGQFEWGGSHCHTVPYAHGRCCHERLEKTGATRSRLRGPARQLVFAWAGEWFMVFWALSLPGRRRKLRTALGLGTASLLFFLLGCGGGGTSGGVGGGGGGGQPQSTSISVSSSNPKVAYGTPVTITATITASKPLTGTVNFYNFGNLISQDVPVIANQAQLSQGNVLINIGYYQITATYSGDANNLTSTSAPITQAITGTFMVSINASTGSDFHFLNGNVGLQ